MEKLFSITKDDFEVQFFRAGGKGGQKQNKTSSGVRVIHKESGAVGEGRRERSQLQNKKIAFRHCINSDKFKLWFKIKTALISINRKSIEEIVDEQMDLDNLKIEIRQDGRWMKEKLSQKL